MRYISILIFLFNLLTLETRGQETATISGLVMDQSTNTSLPYATILIKSKKDSALMTGIMSGPEGRFTLAGIPKGNYVITVSFVGFKPVEYDLVVGDLNKVFDLGKILLSPQSENLGDVIISAQKEIVSAGLEKKSFDLSENISQQTGSVLESLRNLPGVTVSPEGKVSIRGSDQVSVLVDGNQSSLTGFGNQKGLDNVPAANIERIEIINNPSAKYNAMGLAGIINIIYKKEKTEGLHGEAGMTTGIGEWWQRKENLPRLSPKYSQTPKLNPNLSMNFRSKKTNWFLQADGIIRKRVNANEFTTRDYSDGNPDIASQFLENRTQKLCNIKGGLDWFWNARNSLTLFALWQDEYHIDRGDVPYDNRETGKRNRLWTWREDERTRFINYAANFHHKFIQPGHELRLGYLYTGGGEDEFFPFGDSSALRNDKDATFLTVYEYVNAFTIDYVKPLRAGRLETGSRISLRNIPITFTLTPGQNSILDPNLGAWSKYQEDVFASYINFIRESTMVDVEAGLRFEPSFVTYELDPGNIYYKNNRYEYFPLFPNVRISFRLNNSNSISVFHNRRVDRPGEFDVRPFPKYDDPEILKTGNPNLRPQFTNTFEAAYKKFWASGSFFSSLYYRSIKNIFSRIYTIDVNGSYPIVNTIPSNLGKGTNGGLELTLQQTISTNWRFTSSLNLYRNTINSFSGSSFYPYEQTFQSPASEIYTGNFKVISNVKLPRQIEFQLSSVYYAPDIIPQGKIKSRYSLDFGLKKTSKNKKLEWRLTVTDLLNTFQIRKEISGQSVTVTAYNYYETQVVNVGMRFKF